jgi:hypothetical protein
VPGMCALCGHEDQFTVLLTVACPPASFGGWQQMRWPSSNLVCRACTWAMEGKPPNTLRMWSVILRGDGVLCGAGPDLGTKAMTCNRSNLSLALQTLCFPPNAEWGIGIAESGKVHVVPYIPKNTGNGPWSIRMDRLNLRSAPSEMRRIVHHVASLMVAGYGVKSIAGRNPPTRDLIKNGIDIWKEHTTALGSLSAGQIERLALMMLRKETANEWRDKTKRDA